MVYNIKFMFADAVTMEEDFDEGTLVLQAKQKLMEKWPAEKDPVSGPEDIRMIHGGKVLEDSKTFEDYKVRQAQKVIMHLQPKPASAKVEVVEPPPKPVEHTKCCTIL